MASFPFHALLPQRVWCNCLRIRSVLVSFWVHGLAELRGGRSWSMLLWPMGIVWFIANLHLSLASTRCQLLHSFCLRLQPPLHRCQWKRRPRHHRWGNCHLHRLVGCLGFSPSCSSDPRLFLAVPFVHLRTRFCSRVQDVHYVQLDKEGVTLCSTACWEEE